MTNETRVNISDLQHLTVGCPQCHTATTYDLEKVNVTPPDQCPYCGQKMDTLARAVVAFRQLYQDLRYSTMSFRIVEGEQ
jgi:hypothetical protein